MWELVRKRRQYQQVWKPKVADCGMDRCSADGGSSDLQAVLPTPVVTIHSLKERLNLSPCACRQTSEQATPATVAPVESNAYLDPKKINGEVCLLTDSPYRILRVSNSNI
jgi:hypothetical protein